MFVYLLAWHHQLSASSAYWHAFICYIFSTYTYVVYIFFIYCYYTCIAYILRLVSHIVTLHISIFLSTIKNLMR